jgi:hypothetical protein
MGIEKLKRGGAADAFQYSEGVTWVFCPAITGSAQASA